MTKCPKCGKGGPTKQQLKWAYDEGYDYGKKAGYDLDEAWEHYVEVFGPGKDRQIFKEFKAGFMFARSSV